jgi:hypothetical protein
MKIQLIPPAFSWESQARQYAESGAPGLTLEQHMVEVKTGIEVFDDPVWDCYECKTSNVGVVTKGAVLSEPLCPNCGSPCHEAGIIRNREGVSVINCLLFRDEDGSLVAILNHYDGKNPLEAADAVNLWVRPDRQREGIGKMMTREAMQRWPGVRLENQRYTRMGMHLLKSLVRDNERKNNDG